MICKMCKKSFVRKHPNQKFCSHKGIGNCKDKYHNMNNPRGIGIRISIDILDFRSHLFEDVDVL